MLKRFTKQDAIIALMLAILFINVIEIAFKREDAALLTKNTKQYAIFDFRDAIESTLDKDAIKKAKSTEEAEAMVKEAAVKVENWLTDNLHNHCKAPCLVFKKDVAIGDIINLNEIYLNAISEVVNEK